MDDNDILIDEHGNIRFVYSDLLDSVFADEQRDTKRASHVEPHPTMPGWLADMSPSGDTVVLGRSDNPEFPYFTWFKEAVDEWNIVPPFKTRAEALAAEREWLRIHKGL